LTQGSGALTKESSSTVLLLLAAAMRDLEFDTLFNRSWSSESTTCSESHAETRSKFISLCYATVEGDIDTMANLMEANANVNFQDYVGQTPLHLAAASGVNVEAAALLIQHGSNIDTVNKVSQTPLDVAIRSRNRQVEQLLRAKGAKIQQVRLINRSCCTIDHKEVIVGAELGCTLKSKVFRGKWRTTDVVLKYPLDHVEADEEATPLDRSRYEEMLHQISILQSLWHPDLVMFLGAFLQDPPIMLVIEYMPGGDLERYYKAKRKTRRGIYRPPIHHLLAWAKALCRALQFLHGSSQCYIHRDLKPSNLLLSHKLELKVADFGISKFSPSYNFSDYTKMAGGVGSLRYMAPEIMRHQQYSEKADIYSAGLIFYFMSSGRAPYHEHGTHPEVVLETFLKGQEPRPQSSECHQFLRHIMESAWHQDAESRPCARELRSMLLESYTDSPCCTVS